MTSFQVDLLRFASVSRKLQHVWKDKRAVSAVAAVPVPVAVAVEEEHRVKQQEGPRTELSEVGRDGSGLVVGVLAEMAQS